MTLDHLVYVSSTIHDWNKSSSEITKRATEIVLECERVTEAQKRFNDFKRGLDPLENLIKNLGEKKPTEKPFESSIKDILEDIANDLQDENINRDFVK